MHARWISRPERPETEGSIDLEFQASPLDAAGSLTGVLWEQCFAAVVTSATLTTTGGFQRFSERTGIPEGSRYVSAPSGFPYAERAVLAVPRMATDPGRADDHSEEVARLLATLIDPDEGSSIFACGASSIGLRKSPPALLARAQSGHGDQVQDLVDHRARIDAGEGSVIFGLASFAEGIDLPATTVAT